MRFRFGAALAVLFCLLCACAVAVQAAAAEPEVPRLEQRVTDLTGTLTPAFRQDLTQRLAQLEREKGAQIAVLMVPTTGDDSIEGFATRVFDQWRLGRKNVDDGILFVIAKDDRRLRMEVGYGLEGAVPDIAAGRIIREQVTPRFAQGDFEGGVSAGVDSLVRLVNGEELPPPAPGWSGPAEDEGEPAAMLLPVLAFSFLVPAGVAAVVGGVFGYLIFNSMFLGFIGMVLALVASFLGRRARVSRELARASRRGGVIGGLGGLGGFRSTRSGGGFSGGGGFGGGGFGGGGGGSGGGGASGSW